MTRYEQYPSRSFELLRSWFTVRDVPVNLAERELFILAYESTTSWVSYWASRKLKLHFAKMPPPLDARKRQVWIEALLDNGYACHLIDWYNILPPRMLAIDECAKCQADFIKSGYTIKIPVVEHTTYLYESVLSYKGWGILPGYIRRTSVLVQSIPSLLLYFKQIYKLARNKCKLVMIALYDSILLKSSDMEPIDIENQAVCKSKQECPTCFEMVELWKIVRIATCQEGHYSCDTCLGRTIASKEVHFSGKCAGYNCNARANRREMEMVGVSNSTIYKIIRQRYWEHVRHESMLRICSKCELGAAIGPNPICVLCDQDVTIGTEGRKYLTLMLLRGLAASISPGGNGLFRECYHCACTYQKGEACSTITCVECNLVFHFSDGPRNVARHSYNRNGVSAQWYVPKKKGILWNVGAFKRQDGSSLQLGQILSATEQAEVLRRAKYLENDYL